MASAALRRQYRVERTRGCGVVGMAAVSAWQDAITRRKWWFLDDEWVRLRVEPDESYNRDDYDYPPDDTEAYGIIGEYRTEPDGPWHHGDSLWGCTGIDRVVVFHATAEIMAETLDAFRAAMKARCPFCRGTGRRP